MRASPVSQSATVDASARPGASDEMPYGSHTRRLTARFVRQWLADSIKQAEAAVDKLVATLG